MMKVYRVDIGPHRDGRRWRYIACDGKETTELCSSPAKARAAWKAGDKQRLPEPWQTQEKER